MKEEKENLYAGKGVIRVHSGTYINLQDIDVDQIKIEDIAHALSNICRWGGHCENFYSVAEHCIHVVMLMEYQNEINTDVQYSKRDLLAALLHDATEAYLVDMPSPIKSLLPDFQRLEKGVESIIKTRFGIESFDHVKEWDKVSLEMEWKLDRAGHLKGVKPKQAKKRFLKVYNRLTSKESIEEIKELYHEWFEKETDSPLFKWTKCRDGNLVGGYYCHSSGFIIKKREDVKETQYDVYDLKSEKFIRSFSLLMLAKDYCECAERERIESNGDKSKSFDGIVKNLAKLAIKDSGLISTGNDLARELNELEDKKVKGICDYFDIDDNSNLTPCSREQYDTFSDDKNELIEKKIQDLSKELESLEKYPPELTKEQSYQCTVEEIENDYQRREKLLGEIMAADEKDGLYDMCKKQREKDIIITHQIPQPKLKTWSTQLKELEFEKGRQEVEDHIKMKWAKVGNSHIGRVFGFDIKFIVEQDEIYFYASEVRDCDAGRFDNLEEAKQWCREEALRLIKIKQK